MTEPTSNEQASADPVEQQLGVTLHRIADDAPTAPVDGGRALVERRVRQRAARKRQMMGVGMAAAVVALVGGVVALRPDPATKLSFGDSPGAASPASGNVTGYATGSITGSPKGWATSYLETADSVDLPKLVLSLDDTWTPTRVGSVTSQQGGGESASPLLVLADGTGYVVASVQPVSDLGPGRGEEAQLGGHHATVVRRSAGVVQAVVDLDGSTRALVSSAGVGEDVLSAVVGSLRQQDGAWAMDPPAGSTLAPVATTVPSSYQQRSVEWFRPIAPAATTTSSDPANPVMVGRGSDGETVQFNVSTGGAYEFYGLLAQRSGWSRVVPAADGRTKLGGVDVVAAVTLEDGSGGSTVLAYDSAGLVYQVDRFLMAQSPDGVTPVELAPMTVQVATSTEAGWGALVTTAAQQQAQEALDQQAAIEQKMGEIAAKGGDVASATTMPPVAPPTTAP